MQRVCWRCNKKFVCKGDCKASIIRKKHIDYCRCPKCLKKDTLRYIKNGESEKDALANSELCEMRLKELREFGKEKVVFT